MEVSGALPVKLDNLCSWFFSCEMESQHFYFALSVSYLVFFKHGVWKMWYVRHSTEVFLCVLCVHVMKYFIFSSNKTKNMGEIASGILCLWINWNFNVAICQILWPNTKSNAAWISAKSRRFARPPAVDKKDPPCVQSSIITSTHHLHYVTILSL